MAALDDLRKLFGGLVSDSVGYVDPSRLTTNPSLFIQAQSSESFLSSLQRYAGQGLLDLVQRLGTLEVTESLYQFARSDERAQQFLLNYVPGGPTAPEEQRGAFLHNCAMIVLLYFSLYGARYDDASFSKFFDASIAPEYLKERVGVSIVPFPTLRINEALALSDSVILRPTLQSDVERWNNGMRSGYLLPAQRGIEAGGALLELRYRVALNAPASSATSSQFDAFRVAAFLALDHLPIDFGVESIESTFRGHSGGIGIEPGRLRVNPLRIEITPEKATQLASIFEAALATSQTSRYAIAIRRFLSSDEKLLTEDRFIDAWIALEAIFGTDSEISFRLATRIAVYLGDDGAERLRIFEQARALYSVRSKLVHGSLRSVAAADHEAARALLIASLRKLIVLRCEANGPSLDRDLLLTQFSKPE